MKNILYLEVMLLLMVSVQARCTLVESLVQSKRERYVLLARRGVPHTILGAYLGEYFAYLCLYISTISKEPMGSQCLAQEQLETFSRLYNTSSIANKIKHMRSLDPKMFYLPPEMYSDEEIPAVTGIALKGITKRWETAQAEMQKLPDQVDTKKLAAFPDGRHIFYDPNETLVRKDFKAYMDGTGGDISAKTLMVRVVGLVVRMHLLGVPHKKSLQILRHNTVITFKAIRATRLSHMDLRLKSIFLPWYEQTFNILTSSLDVNRVPEIYPAIIEKHFEKVLKKLGSYETWGKLYMFRFNGRAIYREHVADVLFHKKNLAGVLDDIASRAMVTKIPQYPQSSIHLGQYWGRTPIEEKPTSREFSCARGYYSMSNSPEIPKQICCPILCQTAHVLNAGSQFTTLICCYQYNKDPSILVTSQEFVKLSTIVTISYGLYVSQYYIIIVL